MKGQLSRRKFLGGTAAALAGTAATAGNASAHGPGLAVYTTTDLNAREGAGTNYGSIATVQQYTGGRILEGPVNADGYHWYKVRWNSDDNNGRFTGWSASGDDWIAHADVAYPSYGYISSDFYDSRGSGTHEAVDVANDRYTNVYAGRGGYHTTHWHSSYGNYSTVDHGGGYETLYAHLVSFVAGNGVNVGDYQHIAEMGSTGNSTGPHVHYEVRYNGDRQYVAGTEGESVWSRTGVAKNYGLSSL